MTGTESSGRSPPRVGAWIETDLRPKASRATTGQLAVGE